MEMCLLVIRGKQRGQRLRFTRGDFVVGRGPECQIRATSEWISRQHCLLHVTDDHVDLRDLGSTNGTLVNGIRVIGQQRLAAGDLLHLGPLVLQVERLDPKAIRETREFFIETSEGDLGGAKEA